MVKLSKIAIDTDWHEEDYDVPSDLADEVYKEYDRLDDWRAKKDLLSKIKADYPDTELEGWANEQEDELRYNILPSILEPKLMEVINSEAQKMGDPRFTNIYYEAILNNIPVEKLLDDVVSELFVSGHTVEKDAGAIMKDTLDYMIAENQRKILLDAQESIKDQVGYESTRDIVRHMQTPKELSMTEIPTEPGQLENIPSDQGLGSVSNRKNNRIKRGGKMLTKLFKLANSLDKKGEYELASEVDKVIKELSRRVGLTAKEMVSLANELDENGETELADKLDVVLAKGKYKTWKGPGQKPPVRTDIKKPPKGWMDDAKKKIKSKNPKYPEKRLNEIAGDQWFNEMSDAQRNKAFKEYGKKGKAQK